VGAAQEPGVPSSGGVQFIFYKGDSCMRNLSINRWARLAASAAAVVVLAAVPALGITCLAKDAFSLTGTQVSSVEGLLAFDAPAATLASHQVANQTIARAKQDQEAVTTLNNWEYTSLFSQLQALQNAELAQINAAFAAASVPGANIDQIVGALLFEIFFVDFPLLVSITTQASVSPGA
jgi:hypothetical protein